LDLVDQTLSWGVPIPLVVAHSGYGDNPHFLAGLEARHQHYICGGESTFGVRLPEEIETTRSAVLTIRHESGQGCPRCSAPLRCIVLRHSRRALPKEAWQTVTWREGTRGALRKQFIAVRAHRATGNPVQGQAERSVNHPKVSTGSEGWLLAERPLPGEEGGRKWYHFDLPADTPLERLVALTYARWSIEWFYEDA